MAAYSAVSSFRQMLKQLIDSDQFPVDLPKSHIQSLHENICSLQRTLDQIDVGGPKKWRDHLKELNSRIRDAIYAAQDKIDYSISKGISLEELDEIPLDQIVDEIDLVTEDAEEVVEAIKKEGQTQTLLSENPKPSSSGGNFKIVGQENDFYRVTDQLYSDDSSLIVIPITGMGGLGKTTLARNVYEHPRIKTHFHIRAWVTVSQEYNFKEIYSGLLSSMETINYQAGHYATHDEEQDLIDRVHKALFGRRYLIVIDDVWDLELWRRLRIALPDNENGSRILLTTRIADVAKMINPSGYKHEMQLLNIEDSWELLCGKVFGTDPCPSHLEDTGRSIAEKCKGLPLSISVVGGLLYRERQDLDYWKMIDEDFGAAVANDQDSYMMEILNLSYTHLPNELKGCFLYMAAFPEDSKIRVSKLIKLWVAEGFIAPSSPGQSLELAARNYLEDLIARNLVTVRERSSNGGVKVCGMHDVLWDLADQECRKEKFFHSRKKYGQNEEEDMQMQRRVSIHRNILMSLEQVYNSTQSIKYARTLLYVGPHHHHPLPFCLTFDLLRVLDAFTVYFIDFPDEFLRLIHLRYLSLTYNDDLPPQISQLQKLQVLMVRRQPKLIFVGVSFLPDEIWEMPELRHLWFTESDFPALPPQIDRNRPLLVNLQTLSNVNAAYFDDHVLDNMPNLNKLGMWIEAPDVAICFTLYQLSKLQHFKFVVINPIPGKCIQVEPRSFFPKTLKRLTLSGTGLPWEYMEVVAALPDLEVLKLRELAFHGDEWCLHYKLENLKFLLIEYLNFKKWEADNSSFPCLQRLILRHCYELEEIPSDIGFSECLEVIEVVDCSPEAVRSAEFIMEEQEDFGNQSFEARIFSSWK